MKQKPKKPHPKFPLTPHTRGGWGKRYKGNQWYFPQVDPDEALAAFNARAHLVDIGADAPPQVDPAAANVGTICNKYAIARKADVDAGKLSAGSLADYAAVIRDMSKSFGPRTLVIDLKPDHFTRLYRSWSGLGTHALARNVQLARTIWKYADENDWVTRRPRFGSVFIKPITEKKVGVPPTLDELRAVLNASAGQLRAMIMLGLNGGYGAGDCSALPQASVDFDLGVIRFERPKMKRRRPVDRVMTGWPCTMEALADCIRERDKGDDLVFRTCKGNAWTRNDKSKKGKESVVNAVGFMFRKLCKTAGVRNLKFSDLRHVHRTVADELEKPNAAARIMGHRLPGLAEVYVDRIEHRRILVLTNWIRGRIFGGQVIRETIREHPEQLPEPASP